MSLTDEPIFVRFVEARTQILLRLCEHHKLTDEFTFRASCGAAVAVESWAPPEIVAQGWKDYINAYASVLCEAALYGRLPHPTPRLQLQQAELDLLTSLLGPDEKESK